MTALPQPLLLHRTVEVPVRAAWISRAWPLMVLVPLFAVLAARSWGMWPDPLIDFGRELYVPWRISAGELLYRDLAYFNGPLSPTFNALLFVQFGASLRTLVAANLGILAVTTVLLYHLARQMAGKVASTVATAAFLLLFAFSQFTPIRNYNFVCPYSHEMTHGIALSLAALAALWFDVRARRLQATLIGLLLGLIALTKIEIFLAAVLATGSGMVLLGISNGLGARSIAGRLILTAVAAAAVVCGAIFLLARSMPMDEAISGCFASWQMATDGRISGLPFYRAGMGTLNPLASLEAIAHSAARWALLGGLAFVVGRLVGQMSRRSAAAAGAACGMTVAVALFLGGFNWPCMERALPILLAAVALWELHQWRNPLNNAGPCAAYAISRQAAMRLTWCIFSLALLAKMMLAARICQYGFVLAAPATIAVTLAIFDWLPTRAKPPLGARILPWLATPLLVAYVGAYQLEQTRLADNPIPFGRGADQFAAPIAAADVAAAARLIERRVAPDETLAVLPEGIMLNYLTRRQAPTKYVTWMPPELLYFGEANMLGALRNSPPDWIILAPRDLSEYGRPSFGAGYAPSIAGWIEGHYIEAAEWAGGDDHSPVGWRILKRSTRSN